MADFSYTPDQLNEEATFAIDKVQFGDGFAQRIPSGVNNGLRKWTVTFSDRSQTIADAIVAFFASRNGVTSFTWRPYGADADVHSVCTTYSKPIQNRFQDGAFVWTVNATFEETPL